MLVKTIFASLLLAPVALGLVLPDVSILENRHAAFRADMARPREAREDAALEAKAAAPAPEHITLESRNYTTVERRNYTTLDRKFVEPASLPVQITA